MKEEKEYLKKEKKSGKWFLVRIMDELVGVLTIVFLGLRYVGYIDWSWWWVLSPIWITVCCNIIAMFVRWMIRDEEESSLKAE